MAIPCRVAGAGNNSTAQNVCRITVSQSLSAAPRLEAYDPGSYPAVGSATTTTNEMLAGTAGNSNKSMVSAVDTTSGAPSSNWMPTSATPGGATPNRLKGTTSYLQFGSTPTAGQTLRFNIALEVPSDASVPSSLGMDLAFRYNYTGAPPVLSWHANNLTAGGSEGTPSWEAVTPGTHGLRFAKAGTVAGTYYVTRPPTGVQVAEELWVTV